jgi:hypothetical protein
MLAGFDAAKDAQAAVAEAVAGPFQRDGVGIVEDAMDLRGGDLGAEVAAPVADAQIVGEYQGVLLVRGGDELEQQVGGVWGVGQVADSSTMSSP